MDEPKPKPKPQTLDDMLVERIAAHRQAAEREQAQAGALLHSVAAHTGAIQELETLRSAIRPAPNPVEQTA